MVLKVAHISGPAAFVSLDVWEVLLMDELAEGGDLFERSLFLAGVVAGGDLVQGQSSNVPCLI
jgi:hypothetical protein